MKRIVNPWSGMEGYGCYGCAPHNASGLRMEFYEQGDYIVSRWLPRAEYEGWVDTLHGAIQAALADEIASWVVFRKLQTAGVTSRLEMRYHRPILVSQGEIELRARIVSRRRNLVGVGVEILDCEGRTATEAEVVYFVFSEKVARERMHFCGWRTEEETQCGE